MPTTIARARSLEELSEEVEGSIQALQEEHATLSNIQANLESFFNSSPSPASMRVMTSFDKWRETVMYARRSGQLFKQFLDEAANQGRYNSR